MPRKLISQKLIKLFAILAVCILLIFFNPGGIVNPLRGIFFKVSYPFQKTFYLLSLKIKNTFDFLGSISELKKENEKIIRENNLLSAEIATLRDAKKQNEILREQLNLIPKGKFNLEASFVIGQDPQRFGNWLTIDKGLSSGISVGMPVIVSEGILIGRVAESHADSAKISLLTDSSSLINGLDVETDAKGIIRGEYGLGIALDLVPQTDIINVGDTIVTSGLGGNLPRGLLIGKIQEIRLSQDKLFQQAVIMTKTKYQKIDVVFVIKK
jgi:rod shape-determining protein MreC